MNFMSTPNPISTFKGIHKDKRLFILASGPSLSDHDLSLLDRRMVMGLNRSFFNYADTYYHCCMDQRLFELYEEEMKRTRVLFTLEGRPWGVPLKLLGSEGFSYDLEEGVFTGYTISYLALQVALYMGFSEVYFLGLDLKFKDGSTHFFGKDFHSRNHQTTEFPKMKKMLERAADEIKGTEMKVFNCSPVSDLECFEKADYEWAVAL
jgi:hypothetical protein